MGCWGIKALESDEGLDIINRTGKDTSKGRAFAVGEVEWGKQMLGCLWGCVRRWESAYKANGVGRGHYGVSGWGAV